MPNIRPVSDLRNYPSVLREVEEGSPVYLTKNGKGVYALLTMEDYKEIEKMLAAVQLKKELELAEKVGEEEGWLSLNEFKAKLKER